MKPQICPTCIKATTDIRRLRVNNKSGDVNIYDESYVEYLVNYY